jgi:hypothetical protein
MKFEIVNPSDPYTLQADDLRIAALACVLLGEGQYALRSEDGETAVPLFIFGGHDTWFVEKFGATLQHVYDSIVADSLPALAACLESVKLPDGVERSSMNNIGGYAAKMAIRIREMIKG